MEGFTYDQLFAALQTWPEDDASEYLADLPRIISLGEIRLVVDLNLEIFDQTHSNVVVTGNQRLVTKPTGTISTRKLGILVNGRYYPLLLRTRDWCDNYAPDATLLAQPKFYCEYSETQWEFVATPNQNMLAKAVVIARPAGLSGSNQNTWLGDNAGDLLFGACLMEAEHWIKADDRYADIKAKYAENLAVRRLELQNLIRNPGYSPYKPAPRPAGQPAGETATETAG